MIRKTSKFSLALFISTFFYTGLIYKKAPGTIGSIFATLCCFILLFLNFKQFFILTLITFVIGTISSHIFLFKEHGDTNRDPGYIVIDEACGIFLGATILGYYLDLSNTSLFINFIFFRIFDIWKPFPIRNIEKILKNCEKTTALGIMLDDILASIIGTIFQITISSHMIHFQ